MAIPVIVAGAAKLLAIPGVREAAIAGAQKLASSVQGRMTGSPEIGASAILLDPPLNRADLDEAVEGLARELRSELREARRTTMGWLLLLLIGQTAATVALLRLL